MRLTILLPARDAAPTIDAAVASLLAQTWTDFRLLALDDGSKDDTGAHLEAWARKDARVEVVHTGALGLVGALNLGLARVDTPLLARMDADDESLPTRLEKSVAALERGALSGVGTGVEIFRDDRPPSPNLVAYGRWLSSLTSSELVFRDRFVESPLCHPSMTLVTEAVRAVGGWRDGAFPEDWELWLRLMEAGHRLACLPEVLHRWRDHDRRLTRQDERYSLERHLDLKADYLSRCFPKVILWGATDTGRGLSRRLRARGVTVRGFVELNPRKLGQRIHDLPVVAPDALESLGDGHVLSCVAAKGARDDIREWFRAHGLKEGEHFTVVA